MRRGGRGNLHLLFAGRVALVGAADRLLSRGLLPMGIGSSSIMGTGIRWAWWLGLLCGRIPATLVGRLGLVRVLGCALQGSTVGGRCGWLLCFPGAFPAFTIFNGICWVKRDTMMGDGVSRRWTMDDGQSAGVENHRGTVVRAGPRARPFP